MRILLLLVGAAILLGGCGQAQMAGDLDSRDPAARILALRRLAAEGRADGPTLRKVVDELDSGDAAVRLHAIRALEAVTQQTLGYRWYADAAERREAVKAWRRWLDDRFPPSATRPGGAAS